jgi:hypothetical protein
LRALPIVESTIREILLPDALLRKKAGCAMQTKMHNFLSM